MTEKLNTEIRSGVLFAVSAAYTTHNPWVTLHQSPTTPTSHQCKKYIQNEQS